MEKVKSALTVADIKFPTTEELVRYFAQNVGLPPTLVREIVEAPLSNYEAMRAAFPRLR